MPFGSLYGTQFGPLLLPTHCGRSADQTAGGGHSSQSPSLMVDLLDV